MIRRYLLVFAGSMLTAALVANALPAGAWFTRNNPAGCTAAPVLGMTGTAAWDGARGVSNSNATNGSVLHLVCPIEDSSSAPKTGITDFNVHVHDGNDDAGRHVSVSVCATFFNVLGAACTSLSSTNSPNTFKGTTSFLLGGVVAGFAAAHPADFIYLDVFLPDADGAASTDQSTLLGYFSAGN